jgi:hypothetical protein
MRLRKSRSKRKNRGLHCLRRLPRLRRKAAKNRNGNTTKQKALYLVDMSHGHVKRRQRVPKFVAQRLT